MPYRSAKQRRFMHARHPEIARRWDAKYGGKVVKSSGYGSPAVTGRRVSGDDVAKGLVPKRIKLEPRAKATQEQKDAPLWPLAAALGQDDAGRLMRVNRLQQTKGNVRVRKGVGDWKTIDQRERSAARARRSQRRGGAVAATGVGLLTAAELRNPGATRAGIKLVRVMANRQNRKLVHPHIRRDLAMSALKSPHGAMQAGGVGLIGVGGAGVAQGKAREAYHQHKINDRRRARVRKGFYRQSVQPVTARVKPNRNFRRIVTGDQENARRVIGKLYTEHWRETPEQAAARPRPLTQRLRRKLNTPGYRMRTDEMHEGAYWGPKPPPSSKENRSNVGKGLYAIPARSSRLDLAQASRVADRSVRAKVERPVAPGLLPRQQKPKALVGKRSYDPENERRFRQGAAAAGSGLAGAGALGYAAREGRDATRVARRGAAFGPHRGNVALVEFDNGQGGKVKAKLVNQRAVHVADRLGRRGLAITGRGAAAGTAGLGLLGLSGAIARNRHEERWD